MKEENSKADYIKAYSQSINLIERLQKDNMALKLRCEKYREACREAENALLDYVERLEKTGGMMNYGRKVLMQLKEALSEEK